MNTELLLEILPLVQKYYQTLAEAAELRGEGQRMELLEQAEDSLVERIKAAIGRVEYALIRDDPDTGQAMLSLYEADAPGLPQTNMRRIKDLCHLQSKTHIKQVAEGRWYCKQHGLHFGQR